MAQLRKFVGSPASLELAVSVFVVVMAVFLTMAFVTVVVFGWTPA
jgi:hypothetical protein